MKIYFAIIFLFSSVCAFSNENKEDIDIDLDTLVKKELSLIDQKVSEKKSDLQKKTATNKLIEVDPLKELESQDLDSLVEKDLDKDKYNLSANRLKLMDFSGYMRSNKERSKIEASPDNKTKNKEYSQQQGALKSGRYSQEDSIEILSPTF